MSTSTEATSIEATSTEPMSTDAWRRLASVAPDTVAAWAGLHDGIAAVVDRDLLELCRLRISMLLGDDTIVTRVTASGVDPVLIAAVSQWPTSDLFDERQRAALACAEQFVIDVSSITQPDIDRLLVHMSASECYAFIHALWCVEVDQRVRLTLGLSSGILAEPMVPR